MKELPFKENMLLMRGLDAKCINRQNENISYEPFSVVIYDTFSQQKQDWRASD